MNEYNDLFFINEADDDEEKKKNDDKEKDDKKEEKEKKDSKEKEDDDDDYNDLDLMGDDDSDTDIDDVDDSEESDDDYNDLMDDDDIDTSDNTDDSDSSDYNALLVVSDTDDKSSDNGDVYEKAAKAAYAYVVISNNMKHVHLNVCGRKFNEIHQMCDTYYNHFSDMADYFYELAAQSTLVTLDNPTRAKEHCEDIDVETEKEYDFKSALMCIDSNIKLAIKYISELRESSDMRTDVQSKVDDELGYLNKESRYFIRRRLKEPMSSDNDVEMEAYAYNDLL